MSHYKPWVLASTTQPQTAQVVPKLRIDILTYPEIVFVFSAHESQHLLLSERASQPIHNCTHNFSQPRPRIQFKNCEKCHNI